MSLKFQSNRLWIAVAAAGLTLASLPATAEDSVGLVDLSGRRVELFQDPNITQVFLFTRTDCPISNRYAPEVQRLAAEYQSQDMQFWLVYVDPRQPTDEVARHREEYGYSVPALLDREHRLVRKAGVDVTPEAAVFVGNRLVYRGRIDDRYVAFGKARRQPTRRDLEEVLEALNDGSLPELRTTPAIGCYISDLR